MSDIEKLQKAIELLNAPIPVLMLSTVSVPIYNAIVLIDGVRKNLEEQNAKNGESKNTDISVEVFESDKNGAARKIEN